MQTRYMERSNSMGGREKRSLDSNSNVDEDAQPDRKRPALARLLLFLSLLVSNLMLHFND